MANALQYISPEPFTGYLRWNRVNTFLKALACLIAEVCTPDMHIPAARFTALLLPFHRQGYDGNRENIMLRQVHCQDILSLRYLFNEITSHSVQQAPYSGLCGMSLGELASLDKSQGTSPVLILLFRLHSVHEGRQVRERKRNNDGVQLR